MSSCVIKEYQRLKNLFTNVDESKSELVDELLRKASFLKVELDDLEEQIKLHGKIERSNPVRKSKYAILTRPSFPSKYDGIKIIFT